MPCHFQLYHKVFPLALALRWFYPFGEVHELQNSYVVQSVALSLAIDWLATACNEYRRCLGPAVLNQRDMLH